MIDETLRKIENRIEQSQSLKPGTKQELRELLATLKDEVGDLSQSDIDHAQSIAGFMDVSTHEATRTGRKQQSLQHALAGLTSSVDGFEKAHPKLVAIVNRISYTLSNMGI